MDAFRRLQQNLFSGVGEQQQQEDDLLGECRNLSPIQIHNKLLTLIAIIVEICAPAWYDPSYIPFARKFASDMLIRVFDTEIFWCLIINSFMFIIKRWWSWNHTTEAANGSI